MVVTTDCYLFGLKTTQYFLFDAHNFGIQSQARWDSLAVQIWPMGHKLTVAAIQLLIFNGP